MNKTHTPGPWQEIPGMLQIEAHDYALSCDRVIAVACGCPEMGEARANAALIAAAPDLLAERDLLKAQVEELRGALEAYHEFGIFVALVRGPSGEDIQPRLAEAQIMARDALAKVSR